MLTIKQIESAKPGAKDYKLSDRDGLYLFVATTGTKSWRANYRAPGAGGKTVQRTRTYGQYPALTLADARKANDAARDAAAAPADAPAPTAASAATFNEVMKRHLLKHLPTLKNPKHRLQYEATLQRFVCPVIGERPIDTIKRKELVEIVESIQKKDAEMVSDKSDDRVETAHRVAGRITAVFNFAQDAGLIDAHPAANLTRVLKSRKVKAPMACVKPEEAGKLLIDIDTYPEVITRLAMKFMAVTFGRVSELLFMEWDELEEDGAIWVAPEEHVKGEKGVSDTPHVVPLSTQARAILAEVRRYTGECKYVFESPARPGHPLSENTLLFALYRLGYRGVMTVHGFRALFSTVCNEKAPVDLRGPNGDIIEKQLNHRETNEVRAAYNRAMYLPQRRQLMQWYSDWLDAQREAVQPTSARPVPAADTRELSPA